MKFLFRLQPLEEECLSSYISRIAKVNYVTPHEIWRLILPEGAHYPQTLLSSSLDICPDSLFDMKKFANMLQMEESNLYLLTFREVFSKLGITKVSRSRSLSGLLHKKRRFCSVCLQDNVHYKLLWQIKEIPFCHIHSNSLSSKCDICNNEIYILPNSDLGICSYCNFELKNNSSKIYTITQNDISILQDWMYLLDVKNSGIIKIKNFTHEQSLALKLLYLIDSNVSISLSNKDITSINIINQVARNSLSINKSIHLNIILYWIRKLDIQIQDFFTLGMPDEFIESIFHKATKLINGLCCIAPWCVSFNKPGSLKKTLTSKNTRKSGQVFHYYMYCTKCGIQYCNDNYSLEMIERGYFINLAWNNIRKSLYKQYSLKILAAEFNTTVDKTRRSIIFLVANNLVDSEELSLNIPKYHDYEIIKKIKIMISKGMLMKNIKSELSLTYNEILFYWLKSDIIISYIEKNVYKTENHTLNWYNDVEINNSIDLVITHNKNNLFLEAIDFLNEHNLQITIKNMSTYLNVCPETLRNWGLLPYIKKAKQDKKNKEHEDNITSFILSAEKIVNDMLSSNEEILSDEVYKRIRKKRNVIVRQYPEVTKKISQIIKEGKSRSKSYS